jgi:S-methylmethionine-dependent homocysteine/selenocysteine methylase
MYKNIQKKLDSGQTIILDGGTGTDIQRRGVPMSGETWCADANLTHPDTVQAVHEDYIAAGADIIIANTFATSALLFNNLKRDEDLLEIDRVAVKIAKNAVAAKNSQVAVAGSISTMRPMVTGSDRKYLGVSWPEAEARRLFQRKADNLANTGVDLIMMELMRDCDYALWATEAAMKTGLPVWIGVSAERRDDGVLVGFGRPEFLFEDVVQTLAATKPVVISVMHTSANDTADAIDVVRRHWDGPLGTYPESGYFKSPDWVFVDVIPPAALVEHSRMWETQGASIFGGCCGIGPDHIAALTKEFKT